jgi:DNA mismatch endonuclease (patch repair protein)
VSYIVGVTDPKARRKSAKPAEPAPPDAIRPRVPLPLNEGRSRNMRANRRTGTKPELALRSALHRRGHRFRKDLRVEATGVRVRPDIVFTRLRVAVFVDGCFWHACPDHSSPPRNNEWYWGPKLQRNVDRDRLVTDSLESAGWRVVRVWEHEPLPEAVSAIERVLRLTRSAQPGSERRTLGSNGA